jgi:uncharacterized protein
MSADLGAGSPAELKRLPVAGRDTYLFHPADDPHLLLVDGSQIFKVSEKLADQLAAAVAEGADATRSMLAAHGLDLRRFIGDEPPHHPPVRALSLAVAGRCNLGCTYCYAEGGSFGGTPREMPWEVAEASVRRLFADTKPGERVNLAFLGGEPLVNRPLIRRATELAARIAVERGIPIGFSITTNGTLLSRDDAEFFECYGFAVTVSLDGVGAVHDRLRPTKSGRGSYDRVIARVQPLLARQRRMQVSARVTVTPANLGLRPTLDHFIALGFHSVGFSPMLSAPSGRGEMQAPDLGVLLDEMVDCGREFERRTVGGERYPFSNMTTALAEIHRGTHRPYPCGAGASYFGVSASGGLFACHRFVDDPKATMGDVTQGVDRGRQRSWLTERMVDRQDPCRSCWARYLCGGGCHYEVIHRGRPACDYIRGWLDYVLGAYIRLSETRPEFFSLRSSDAGRPLRAGAAPRAIVAE